ncbi:hypothetical protein CEXT_476531 [Caerostris extrusa]|uniref:Uncharacterized protein n=1 Tax=Caerostris extrusa TaxID=172846 RepID=A0AAV4XBD6_CAEEX|nr:hypothetical protein CEXT_476531 [Caerostris extrusa]
MHWQHFYTGTAQQNLLTKGSRRIRCSRSYAFVLRDFRLVNAWCGSSSQPSCIVCIDSLEVRKGRLSWIKKCSGSLFGRNGSIVYTVTAPAKSSHKKDREDSVAVAVTLSCFVVSVWCYIVRLQQSALMHSLHRISGASKGVIICILYRRGRGAIRASETEGVEVLWGRGVRYGVLQRSGNRLGMECCRRTECPERSCLTRNLIKFALEPPFGYIFHFLLQQVVTDWRTECPERSCLTRNLIKFALEPPFGYIFHFLLQQVVTDWRTECPERNCLTNLIKFALQLRLGIFFISCTESDDEPEVDMQDD